MDDLTYDLELLFYAANLWRISESALPPSLAETLYRDRGWDSEVATILQLIRYAIDENKNPANVEDKKVHKGIV